MNKEKLRIINLRVTIPGTSKTVITPLKRIGFSVPESKVTAVVGESGSGKTLTGLAVMGLLHKATFNVSQESQILFNEKNLLHCSEEDLRELRGKKISMIFQDAGASLNPVLNVGAQISAPLMEHYFLSKKLAWKRAVELLDEVGVPSPVTRAKALPFELSGGQQQRVMIAAAIACGPELLIADEPTSSLDVTVQRQIIDLLLNLQAKRGMTLLFISHDLGIVSEIADRVVVMRRGEVVEEGTKNEVIFSPRDTYTQALVNSRINMVRTQTGKIRNTPPPLHNRPTVLESRDLIKDYRIRSNFRQEQILNAVKGVSFKLQKGETIGIVGESGSGKTTLAMMLVRLIHASGGKFLLDGKDVSKISLGEFRPLRRHIQVVFQNPYASLNPRWTISRTLINPMKLHGIACNNTERRNKAIHLLEQVGLSENAMYKYPRQFSGGERQRIAIARCLTVEPKIIICDECVSALDATIQLQIIDLLKDLQRKLSLSYLFISHDLAVIRFIADRVLVFRQGEVVEEGQIDEIFDAPRHPYTRQLLSAAPHITSHL